MGMLNLKRVAGVGLQRTPAAPIAVDFGAAALKVLQVSLDETPSLVAAGCVPTPENLLHNVKRRIEFQIEALPKLVSSLPLKGRRAVCAIPSALTFCKHTQLARQEGMPVEVLADTMLTEQLGRDASTLVRRLIEVNDADRAGGGKGEFICLATGREIVEKLMKSIKSAKLDVVGMHSEFESTLRAFAHLNRRESDKTRATAYLDIGSGQTRITIGHGTQLVFARSIDIGGRVLDESVAKELGCTLEQARQKRMAMSALAEAPAARSPAMAAAPVSTDAGAGGVALEDDRRRSETPAGFSGDLALAPTAPTAPGGASLREPLEILTDEVAMCVRYHDAMFRQSRTSGMVFVGGEARHHGMCQHIARTLRISAQIADPLARFARSGEERAIGVDLKQPQPGWAVAVGLCQSPTDL